MTQIVNPSIDRAADSFLTAGSLAYAGLRDGGIVPSGEVTELAKQSAIDETALDGFSFSTSSSSLDVTISPGEAFVFGSWLAKDTTTTVTLPPSSTVSGIILTWDKDSPNTVQIGLSSDFDEFPDPDEYLIVAGGFLTDENGVTQSNDPRKFVSIDAERLEGNETSEIKPNISDSGSTVVENADDINVKGGLSASNDGDGSATIVGASQYTDTDAINAVDSESSLSVNITGDADTVDGFSFVKNGNSGPGIINYQTGIEATGGTTVIDRTINGVDYRIHAFESVGSSTFSVNQAPPDATVDALIVGGGGGGAGELGGGGGGGGVIFSQSISVTDSNYLIVVGDGGSGNTETSDDDAKPGFNGENSEAFDLTALGGGGGGSRKGVTLPKDGGCGGGAGNGSNINGGSALQQNSTSGGFGNDGGDNFVSSDNNYPSSGGGGAGQPGGEPTSNTDGAGDGGDGIQINFTGNNYYWAGGGGGSHYTHGGANGGNGGLGGGGGSVVHSGTQTPQGGGQAINKGEDGTIDTNTNSSTPGGAGGKNTGGGGGVGGHQSGLGGDGGSGIVIIRYEI